MTTLLKTEFVSMRVLEGDAIDPWFQPTGPDDNQRRPTVILPLDTYVEMGEPQTITVTVVPGDTLNG